MIKKILYILDRRQKILFGLLCLVIIGSSFTELLGVALIAPIAAVVTDESIIYSNKYYVLFGSIFNITTPKQYVLTLIVVVIAVYVVKNLYIVFQNYFQYRYVYNNQRRISTKLMEFYISKDYLYHVGTNVTDIQRNMTKDVFAVFDALINIFQVANETLVCAVLVVYLLVQDWVSTILMASVLVVVVLFFSIFYRRYSVALGEQARAVTAEQNKWILQTFAGIKEIKVGEKADYFTNNYNKAVAKNATYMRKNAFVNMLPKPIMELICVGGLLSIIAVRISLGSDMKTFIPILSSFAVAAFRMLPSFNRISAYYGSIMFGKPSVDNVYNDMMEYRDYIASKEAVNEQIIPLSLKDGVQLKNISFTYPGTNEPVLENVNLDIPFNKSIAFVGASGAGKSTLADVILGVLKPQDGQIIVDGYNVLDNLKSWHKKIGYIPQMIYLTDDTIRNNIAFGVEEKDIDDSKVWKAIEDAQLLEFVKTLPEGLNTMVGDRGVRLSGGQRQRIGIARALYEDPEFLVLDEATSALDNDTEAAVMETIDGLKGNRTMLVIAHRLSTIANCDYIYEIGNKTLTPREYSSLV